jgi:carbohydrate diacid regulator
METEASAITEDRRSLLAEIVRRASETLESRVAVIDNCERVIVEAGPRLPPGGCPWTVRVLLPRIADDLALVVFLTDRADSYQRHLMQSIVELILNEITMLDAMPGPNELKNHFVHRLLDGDLENEVRMLREGQMLGMDLTRPRAVILIDASAYIEGSSDQRSSQVGEARPRDWIRAHYIIRSVVSFFSLPTEAICAYIGDGQIAVLKATSSRDLDRWATEGQQAKPSNWSNLAALKRAARELVLRLEKDTEMPVRIGIGRYHAGIRGIARSYQDARAALNIGRFTADPSRTHCLDDLGMAALVGTTDEETRRDLANNLLGPLESEPELTDTLRVFFQENCSPAATSARLFIHRNTLTYRLDKIAALIGLDPKHFEDAMLIRLALMVQTLTDCRAGQLPD